MVRLRWLWWLGLGAVGVGLAAGVGWLLWRGPAWVYRAAWLQLTPAEQVTATGQFRIAVVQVAAAVGAVVALAYTARTYRLSHRGQLTERFSKALERLGSEEPYVRLGGVHALAHVLRESADHHLDVVEVLVAFVRQRTPRAATGTGTAGQVFDASRVLVPSEQALPAEPAPDVQAALTALGRRPRRWQLEPLGMPNLRDLHLAHANLTTANLTDAQLAGANLTGAQLTSANLTRAQLAGANLTGAEIVAADLTRAQLAGANLTGAKLWGAKLTNAALVRADLTGAQLSSANLTDAVLSTANLTDAWLSTAKLTRAWFGGANLTGADLRGANLAGVRLKGALLIQEWLSRAPLVGRWLLRAPLVGRWLSRKPVYYVGRWRADLTGKEDLTQAQLDAARGDATTRLPPELQRPASWGTDPGAVAGEAVAPVGAKRTGEAEGAAPAAEGPPAPPADGPG
jgi:uncharacterized protein YjbI with pentapeptide repeats